MKAAVKFLGASNTQILVNVKASSKNGVITYTHTTGSFTKYEIESLTYLSN
jgi:hypothetical protein